MFALGRTYNVPTFAPAILGATLKHVVLKGILDYDSALAIANIELLQRQVYPVLPVGVPDNPRHYTWYHFKTVNNVSVILADPWIDKANVQTVVSKVATITVPNIIDSDLVRIMEEIRAMGYHCSGDIKDVVL